MLAGANHAASVPGVALYCVADRRYFGGAVGLVNSLRLHGHDEPLFLLDCGLTPGQRELLGREATLVPAPRDAPPWLLKTAAPLAHPAEVMVLLDTDMIATQPLTPLLERASDGRVVAFRNPIERFFGDWGDLLGLGQPRRQPYLSSAAILVDRGLGTKVLSMLTEHQAAVDFELTYWRRNVAGYPFLYADQDVFNAILATSVPVERIVALEERLAATPPFSGLRLVDELLPRCSYEDGVEPYLVHHHVVKPWLEPTHHGVYSRLLRRLLIGPDLPIRVPDAEVPPHLRSGPRAWARRARVNARERLRWHVREPLASRIRGIGSGTGSGER